MKYLILALLMVLPGCSMFSNDGMDVFTTTYDANGTVISTIEEQGANNSDVNSWTEASTKFKEADSKRIIDTVKEIYKQPVNCGGNAACEAYASALKDIAVGFGPNLAVQKFTLVKPKSGYDVVDSGLHIAGDVLKVTVPVLAVADLAKSVVQDSIGTTTLTTANGDINVADSLNRTETHATAVDSSSASTTASQSRDETTDNSSEFVQ